MKITYHLDPAISTSTGQPGGWSLSFQRLGTHIEIGMHFGDKETPTHTSYVPVEAFAKLAKELLA